MPVDRKYRLARLWSNNELRKFAHFFHGEIVNVSGWEDRDKEGGIYSDYFTKKTHYYVTNFMGNRGYQQRPNEIYLNLTEKLPPELYQKFDVVFNHTTLEHIFDVTIAFRNICLLSRDIVILVVPFSQEQHETESYGDYWRFTSTGIRELFQQNNFEIMYMSWNNNKNAAIYIFVIASKKPDIWNEIITFENQKTTIGEIIGKRRSFKNILKTNCSVK